MTETLVEKGTTIPCTIVKKYLTTLDKQREFKFEVYAGQEKVRVFGTELKPVPREHAYVEVTFAYTLSGNLNIGS